MQLLQRRSLFSPAQCCAGCVVAVRRIRCQSFQANCLEHFSQRLVAPPLGDDSYVALIETLAGSQSTPSRHVAREEGRASIEAALEVMPPDYAKVIRMYYLEGQTLPEISGELGRSKGAVFML